MAERSSFAQRWQEYRPTKAVWLWSCVAAAILTLIAGFTWGGWVTGGTASSMAARAAEDAREQLVASICVNRFVNSPNAAATFAKLKEARSWERDDIIEEGGWITIEALDEQIAGARPMSVRKKSSRWRACRPARPSRTPPQRSRIPLEVSERT